MNNSNDLNTYFTFVIVDDDERKIELGKAVLKLFGIDPHVITGEQYYEQLTSAVYQIHHEGRFPVIFLDENLGYKEPSKGTEIAKSLTKAHVELGGILLPGSNDYKEQCDNWWYEINERGKWVFPDEGKLMIEYFKEGDIDNICKDFLNDFGNRESDSEIKVS